MALGAPQSYNGGKAYSQSKIALGLFGLELARRSAKEDWGITSNLAHPGVAPTNLLAARPELGRERETSGRRLIRALSERGILLGTVETATPTTHDAAGESPRTSSPASTRAADPSPPSTKATVT